MKTASQLYGEWRVLTAKEAECIHAGNWAEVDLCQQRKMTLQSEIAAAEGRGSHAPAPLVEELLGLERKNAEALRVTRAQLQRARAELHQSTRQLRKVANAYAFSSVPAWESYS